MSNDYPPKDYQTGMALGLGDAITTWLMTEPSEKYFPGVSRPMPRTLNYEFKNGFVDTGNLPCRDAWLEMTQGTIEDLPDDLIFDRIYCGLGDDVDFSTFRFRPTLVRRFLKCRLGAQMPTNARFQISTCGRVQVWLNGDLLTYFAPRDRNNPALCEFEVAVAGGQNEMVVMLEDLHERDTTCFFCMRVMQGVGLSVGYPVERDASLIEDIVSVVRGLEFGSDRDVTSSVELRSVHVPLAQTEISITSLKQIDRGGMWSLIRSVIDDPIPVTIDPSNTHCSIDLPDGLPSGAVEMVLEINVGNLCLEAKLGSVLLPKPRYLDGKDLAGRKKQAADLIAQRAAADPSTALLLLARREKPVQAHKIIGDTLTTIEDRFDCSDFNILPVLAIWKNHKQALPADLKERMKHALLGYRYWLDEPGNDVMWFWSENHALCFHAAEILAGEAFGKEVFANTGITGDEHQQRALTRLGQWFDSIETNGLNEWNSSAYYPIDILALLSLVDHCQNDEIRNRSKNLLDLIFVMTALHSSGGVPAGSQGRAYEKELLAAHATELGAIAAVAFGGSLADDFDRVAALFALSDYEPPKNALTFSRPSSKQTIRAFYRQGGTAGGDLSLWKCRDVQLSTSDTGTPGDHGHQQHMLDVQFSSDPAARAWINFPGDVAPWRDRRPSFLAGNLIFPAVAQRDNIGLMIYDAGHSRRPYPFVNAYVPNAVIKTAKLDHWLILRCGAGYAGIWCSDDLAPAAWGQYADDIWRTPAVLSAWCVIVGSKDLHGSLDGFSAYCRAHAPSFDRAKRKLQMDDAGGKMLSLDFDHRQNQQSDPPAPWPEVSIDDASFVPWYDAGKI